MQETAVGGVEQGDAKGEIQAHDPELALGREQREVHVSGLDGSPVDVKKDNSGEGKREVADSKHGHVAASPEEDHAARDDECPDEGPDDPEDAEAIESGLGFFGFGHCSSELRKKCNVDVVEVLSEGIGKYLFIVRNVVWKGMCRVSATQKRFERAREHKAEMTTIYSDMFIECESPSVQTLNKD